MYALALIALFATSAQAGRGKGRVGEVVDDAGTIKANASEIPALARLLEKTGWTPTPELSGAFQPGYVFQSGPTGHRLQVEDCFSAGITRSTYTSAEVVSQLQAGVSVGMGPVSGHAEASLVKKVRFGTPEHAAIPELKLIPSPACTEILTAAAARGTDLGTLYVVQEVLTAQITEQTCGQVDAGGQFIAFGSAEASLAMACAQESLEPVAVAYRTVAVLALQGMESVAPRRPPPPVPVPDSAAWDAPEVREPGGSWDVEPPPTKPRKQRSVVRDVDDTDSDGDGVMDVNDACPHVPEDLDGYEDEDGCPDPDNDGDGVIDDADSCPSEAEDHDAFQDDDGCPEPDNDGDGILDTEDQCLMEPETLNGYEDDDGCPDRIR